MKLDDIALELIACTHEEMFYVWDKVFEGRSWNVELELKMFADNTTAYKHITYVAGRIKKLQEKGILEK